MKSYRVFCKQEESPFALVKIGEIRCTPRGGIYLTLHFIPMVEYQLLPDKNGVKRLIIFTKRYYTQGDQRRFRWYAAGQLTITEEGDKRLQLNHIPRAIYIVVENTHDSAPDQLAQVIQEI